MAKNLHKYKTASELLYFIICTEESFPRTSKTLFSIPGKKREYFSTVQSQERYSIYINM
jgi:hypothetical protein